jgi:hypothetical protein
MNHETICNPIPAADVPGFQFYRDQNGRTICAMRGVPGWLCRHDGPGCRS